MAKLLGGTSQDGSQYVTLTDGKGNTLGESNYEYETVAAGQTAQPLGATGAAGDYLSSIIIIPATASPGSVAIKDGTGSDITIFTGGSSSVADLAPISVSLGIKSTSGAWKVTTGSNVSVIGIGNFT